MTENGCANPFSVLAWPQMPALKAGPFETGISQSLTILIRMASL